MERRCNYFNDFRSDESILTPPIQYHWKMNEQPPKEIVFGQPCTTDWVGLRTSVDEFVASGSEDAVFPRTFIPQENDWDCRLEELGYGGDIDLYSESTPTSTDAEEPATIQDTLVPSQLPKHFPAISPKMTDPISELSIKENKTLAIDSIEKLKAKQLAQTTKSKPANVVNNVNDSPRNSQMKLQMAKSGKWTIFQPQVEMLMRRATEEKFRHTILSHSGFKRSHQKTADDFNEHFNEVKRLTNAIQTTNATKHTLFTSKLLLNFCSDNIDKKRELILRGKQVQDAIRRRLQDFDLPFIFLFVVEHPDVVSLDLSYNNITSTGAQLIADFLSWNSSLESLNLMNNEINSIDSALVDALCYNTSLKHLRLNGNPIGKEGGEYVAFLLMFKELELLDLGQTDQNIESLSWISQALIQVVKLTVLDLSRVLAYPRYVSGSLDLALAFSDILRLCNSLVELHLSKNYLADTDVEQLLFGLSFNKTLELLDLSANQIGNHGAEMIANALQYGGPLKALMLGSNQIGNYGARALSFKLSESHIQILDLSNNQIQDQGIIDIVNASKKPRPLLALFIFGNRFHAHALEAIQERALRGDFNIKSLDITIFYCEGAIGYGRRMEADLYSARYYRVTKEARRRKSEQKENIQPPRKPGCLNYKYHNVVNQLDNPSSDSDGRCRSILVETCSK